MGVAFVRPGFVAVAAVKGAGDGVEIARYILVSSDPANVLPRPQDQVEKLCAKLRLVQGMLPFLIENFPVG